MIMDGESLSKNHDLSYKIKESATKFIRFVGDFLAKVCTPTRNLEEASSSPRYKDEEKNSKFSECQPTFFIPGNAEPISITELATALANAPEDQQLTMLGENLYPLVDQLEHDHAAKVTGMLLEMDLTEVLLLLELPDALKSKVTEAMEVPKNASLISISALASAVVNAPADQHRTMLGENLYPLVDQLEHNHAEKVTGMLLEMDETEVLHLLESPDALKAKVTEAMEVLKNVSPMPITALASALANAPVDQHRTMLGENLYPLVDQQLYDYAAKVTGMLLELDQTRVLHLLESPDALKAKVIEAMAVLQNPYLSCHTTNLRRHLAFTN